MGLSGLEYGGMYSSSSLFYRRNARVDSDLWALWLSSTTTMSYAGVRVRYRNCCMNSRKLSELVLLASM